MSKVFEHRSTIPTTLEAIGAFHEHPQAFRRLTPPPVFIQVHRNALQSLTEGEVEFTLWMGPIPLRWLARHEAGPTPHSFIDRQIQGPMAAWEHQHIFEATVDGVTLIDHITFEHRQGWRGWFTRLTFDGLPLRLLFIYRHWRTRVALRQS